MRLFTTPSAQWSQAQRYGEMKASSLMLDQPKRLHLTAKFPTESMDVYITQILEI
ncbi:MAG: hypothetical protein HC772_10110 [Leptolyngbyaceae cyanobacterium CRU_2_3]|nr:hypothetical protein [Leptolyngbyaceae cyanobacterium CRU_2_3]